MLRILLPRTAVVPLLVTLTGCHREPQNRDNKSVRSPVGAISATAPPQTSAQATPRATANASIAGSATPQPSAPDFSPASFAARKPPEDGPRLYAKTRHVWIYAEPDASKQWIGYLWTGGSVRLRDAKPRYGIACDTFYAIEPRGYVCTDGGRATLDPKDPVVVATTPYAPRTDQSFLHRYGESRGAPLYLAPPTVEQQRYRESDLLAHGKRVQAALEGRPRNALLEGVDLSASPEGSLTFPKLSPSVHEAHGQLKARSTVAYSAEVRSAGRDFLLTSDYRFIPKDRVMVYENHFFHGLKLDDQHQLPIAWFRDANRPHYRRIADGTFAPTEQVFARHSYVTLTTQISKSGGRTYIQTADGDWLLESDASIPKLAPKTPWDSVVGEVDKSPLRPKGRATWIEVSIYGGWLIAYEGTRPVFTTLISAGRGGGPQSGRELLETGSTPVGRFAITSKVTTATMIAPNDYIHSEVPYAQVFSGPYALHSAYWHNNWGQLMSGGCINLSPIDAQYMFQWTEPPAPAGWYGTRWLPYLEPSTTLIVRR